MACIHEEIMAMPAGYDTPLNERRQTFRVGSDSESRSGPHLSQDPPILVLNREGTSALDTISEHRVQSAIDALQTDRTVIIVAHRLSTPSAAPTAFSSSAPVGSSMKERWTSCASAAAS